MAIQPGFGDKHANFAVSSHQNLDSIKKRLPQRTRRNTKGLQHLERSEGPIATMIYVREPNSEKWKMKIRESLAFHRSPFGRSCNLCRLPNRSRSFSRTIGVPPLRHAQGRDFRTLRGSLCPLWSEFSTEGSSRLRPRYHGA